MKRLLFAVSTAALIALAPAAQAQITQPGATPAPPAPPAPPAGTVGVAPTAGVAPAGRTPRTGRVPGTGRTERTPGTGRTERTPRFYPADPLHPARPAAEPVRRLPRTGVNPTALAVDGATLLGAGLILLHARRRLLAH